MINENELPKTWEIKKLGEVCDFYQGYGFPKHLQGESIGKYPFYKVGDISKNVQSGFRYLEKCNNFIDEKTLIKLRAKPYPPNTIVFAKIGEALKLNRRAIIKISGIVDNNAIGLKAKDRICNDLFLFHFLQRLRLEDYSRATTVPSVRKSDIEEIPFPLPPLAEQKRIVAKIEELFSELDAGLESLKTAQAQLKIYRQAVLKYAFEGKLTNDNVNEGEIPNGWTWVKIIDLSEPIKNALKAGPFGSSLKKEFYVENGYKIYGQEQVINGDAFFGDYYISEEKYQELNSNKIKPFDVLISLVGTVGKVLILPENCKAGIINPRLIKISLDTKKYLPHFFKYYFESSTVKSFYSSKAQGTTMDVLNLAIIKTIPFPLCSLEEQQRIVEEIESRLSVCDKLEENIDASLKQAEALRQSILKQAFEGKLIAQEVKPLSERQIRNKAENLTNLKLQNALNL